MAMEPRTVERSFDCATGSARCVRRFVDDVLTRWVVGGPADDILLIADELATNAVVHARSHFVVRLQLGERSVRVEVDDASVDPPRMRTASMVATGGRGLLLVDGLAEAWGWDLRRGGKSVWVEVGLATEPTLRQTP